MTNIALRAGLSGFLFFCLLMFIAPDDSFSRRLVVSIVMAVAFFGLYLLIALVQNKMRGRRSHNR